MPAAATCSSSWLCTPDTPDGPDHLALMDDRKPALDGKGVGEIHHAGTLFHRVLPDLAGAVGDSRRTGLQGRDLGGLRPRAIHALEQQETARIVDHGDGHIPLLLLGLDLGRSEHFLCIGERQGGFGAHRSPLLAVLFGQFRVLAWRLRHFSSTVSTAQVDTILPF